MDTQDFTDDDQLTLIKIGFIVGRCTNHTLPNDHQNIANILEKDLNIKIKINEDLLSVDRKMDNFLHQKRSSTPSDPKDAFDSANILP